MAEKRFSVGAFLRLLLTVVLTVWLFYRANPAEIGQALVAVDWRWIWAAIGLALLDRVLMAYRWLWLLRPIDPTTLPPLRTIMRVFFVSTFIGTFLPSGLGNDAVRTWQLAAEGVPTSQSLASVLIDRVLGIVGILVASTLGLILYPSLIGHWVVAAIFAAALAGSVVALSLVYSETCARWAKRLCRVVPVKGVADKAGRLIDALLAYRHHHGAVTLVLGGSIGVQLLRVVQAWCLGLSLGITAPFIQYIAFVPLIVLIMQVSPTINGMGASQGAFEWLFGIGGTAAAPAFALSILFVALGFVGIVPGLVLFAMQRGGTARTSVPR